MESFDPSGYSFDPLMINAAVGWLLHQLKLSSRMSWVSDATPVVLRVLRVTGALITAAGMQITWAVQDGSGTLTISGITAASMLMFGWSFAKQLIAQTMAEGMFQIAHDAKAVKDSAVVLRRAPPVEEQIHP